LYLNLLKHLKIIITRLNYERGINKVISDFLSSYQSALSSLSPWAQIFINLFLLALLVFVYSIFVWKFYRYISKKNLLELNLNKYNKSEHPFFSKVIAGLFYFLEYIIILPFLIFFWFSLFTIFLVVLTQNLEIGSILIISATIIAAVRMSAYYKEEVAREIAKMLPFMLLAVSFLTPGFFDFGRILSQLSYLGDFFDNIVNYLSFIIVLEIVLRFFDFIFSLFGLHKEDEVPK